ncbi:hypothetical protein [Rhizobium freirei]|uniref:hypothetical protein n=1 Tax=Rhizobium freirei TaxID=1353277 RepID=UPI000561CE5A|nr:hypothetical protein [Rhizobium freirei]
MHNDEDLMASIITRAARLKERGLGTINVLHVAQELHALFPHCSEVEIKEKIKEVFRAEGIRCIDKL